MRPNFDVAAAARTGEYTSVMSIKKIAAQDSPLVFVHLVLMGSLFLPMNSSEKIVLNAKKVLLLRSGTE